MILRKPYAFLIKYFRLIHLVLTVLIGILLYNTKQILDFFDSYIASGTFSILSDVADKYVPGYLYLLIFLTLGLCLIIIFLLKTKDKPIRYYIINSCLYLALIIVLVLAKSQLTTIEFNEMNIIWLRVARDVLFVAYILQIPTLIFSISRTLGFDIKKFNFKKDILELDITKEDREEFELDVAVDSEDVKAKLRKNVRNLKYFYKENKTIILIIGAIIILVGGYYVYKLSVQNKVYIENQEFSSYNFNMKVLESYQLTEDYRGNDITNKTFAFVVLKMQFKNKTDDDLTIPLDRMVLRCTDLVSYKPTDKYYDYFIDLGNGYKGQTIPSGETKEYIFVYKIDDDYVNSPKTFEFIKSIKNVNNENIYEIVKVKLSFNEFGETKFVALNSLGNVLEFNDYLLGKSKLAIYNYEISKNFVYEYEVCNVECKKQYEYISPLATTKYDASVMKLNASFLKDENLINDNISLQILSKFTKLRYVIDGEEYVQKNVLNDLTPKSEKDYVYLEVNSNVSKATSIYLDFYIRNFKYTYVLRDK